MNKNTTYDNGIRQEEFEQLEQQHDELRGQAHLLKPEAKRNFDELEKKLQQIKCDMDQEPEHSVTLSRDAARELFDYVQDGFARISRSLQREPAMSGAEEEEEEE